MQERVPVTFEPTHATAWVTPGTTVLDASRAVDVFIPVPCGGRGICGSCGVKVLTGALLPPDADERAGLARAPKGVRLACRARIAGPVVLRPIVVYSRPVVRPPEGAMVPLVAAVDLGTTSVAIALVDSVIGRELVRTSVPNLQAAWGADVLSRLTAALDGHAKELRTAAQDSLADALASAAGVAEVSLEGLSRVTVAANTAMAALLLGEDVSGLATAPFVAPFRGARAVTPSGRLAELLPPQATLSVLPPAAGFVGGDALAGAQAYGLLGEPPRHPRLLVDVGTNAEIVLATSRGLWVASAAAGPAFEGAGVCCGGPATAGAVEHVELGADARPIFGVIGGGEPSHFAGSGLVSALAALRRARMLDADGALHESAYGSLAVHRDADQVLRAYFRPGGGGCLEISQLDVRSLQLAIAAVRTGVDFVLAKARVKPSSLAEVLIAGAFGRAVHADDLLDLGMLPRKTEGRIVTVGNAALDGAVMAAFTREAEAAMEAAALRVTHVDLASSTEFQAALLRSLRLDRH